MSSKILLKLSIDTGHRCTITPSSKRRLPVHHDVVMTSWLKFSNKKPDMSWPGISYMMQYPPPPILRFTIYNTVVQTHDPMMGTLWPRGDFEHDGMMGHVHWYLSTCRKNLFIHTIVYGSLTFIYLWFSYRYYSCKYYNCIRIVHVDLLTRIVNILFE